MSGARRAGVRVAGVDLDAVAVGALRRGGLLALHAVIVRQAARHLLRNVVAEHVLPLVVGDFEVLAPRIRPERLLARPGPAAETRAALAARVRRERPDAHAAERDAEPRPRFELAAQHHELAASCIAIGDHDRLTLGIGIHAGRVQRSLDAHACVRIDREHADPGNQAGGGHRLAPLRSTSLLHLPVSSLSHSHLLSLAPLARGHSRALHPMPRVLVSLQTNAMVWGNPHGGCWYPSREDPTARDAAA